MLRPSHLHSASSSQKSIRWLKLPAHSVTLLRPVRAQLYRLHLRKASKNIGGLNRRIWFHKGLQQLRYGSLKKVEAPCLMSLATVGRLQQVQERSHVKAHRTSPIRLNAGIGPFGNKADMVTKPKNFLLNYAVLNIISSHRLPAFSNESLQKRQ